MDIRYFARPGEKTSVEGNPGVSVVGAHVSVVRVTEIRENDRVCDLYTEIKNKYHFGPFQLSFQGMKVSPKDRRPLSSFGGREVTFDLVFNN